MSRPAVEPADLLVLVAVARTGRFSAAAQVLGLNHTTVARRIEALEKAVGDRVLAKGVAGWELTATGLRAFAAGEQVATAMQRLGGGADGTPASIGGVVRISATDGFSAFFASPAAVAVRRAHPGIRVEIVTATRLASHHRAGLDIEIVVGEPHVHRARSMHIADYRLALYASRSYLARHRAPRSRTDLAEHPLVYFVDAMLQVDELDLARRLVPQMGESVTSTNVFVHVEATRSGAGIGLLPCFMADRNDDLVRVLPEVSARLSYWLVSRAESLRRPEVAAVIEAIQTEVADRAAELLGDVGGAVYTGHNQRST